MRISRQHARVMGLAAGTLLATLAILLIPMSEAGTARGAYASRWLSLLIVCGFLGASIVAAVRRPGNRIWRLMAAVGFAWFLTSRVGSEATFVHTICLLTSMLWMGLLVHMTLAFPSGQLRTAGERGVVAAAYAVGTVLHVPALLFTQNRSITCRDCPVNLGVVVPLPGLADALFQLQLASAVGVLIAACTVVARRWRHATNPERRALAPVLWSGGLTGLVAVVAVTTSVAGMDDASAAIDWVYLLLFASIPIAFLVGLLRSRLYRAEAVFELVAHLSDAPTPRRLRDALAEALGDPSLDIAYWLPEEDRYVDHTGKEIEPPRPESVQQFTEIELDGRRIAAIIHDRSLSEDPELVRAAGAAAALGLERERLDAELRASVDELRASRARIVRAGDIERRRLERDLHDGAQQRIVSLILNLQLARRDEKTQKTLLDTIDAELTSALGDLRRLASGILPPVLSDHGLAAAVQDLAERSPIKVQIAEMPQRRLPHSVEIAAYFIISEALTNTAKYARANLAHVATVDREQRVVVEISDDGVGGAQPTAGSGLSGLADRVGALGGHLDIESRPGDGTTIRAEIPYSV
jgi:signal transduction histidine kinase